MTAPQKPAETGPIMGYGDIAKAVTKALGQSVSARTARRWATQKGGLRLPVNVYPNRRAYLLHEDLALFVAAWKARRPSGGQPAGAKPKAA